MEATEKQSIEASSGSESPARDAPVVELDQVFKTFRQRQPSPHPRDLIRNLFRPVYRQAHALQGISVKINRGEIVAYAGANGAGKSTTIKILSGLLAPDSGRVRVFGQDPSRERTRIVSRIGVVFGQRTELWWDHPVSASFEWKRVIWDIPDDQYQSSLQRIKNLMGLDEFFDSLARDLSLGQRMRADLGMALLPDPEMVFLDEPTLGLDVLAKRRILEFIQEMNRTRQLTVLVTSHDMADLEQLAERIVLIDRGKVAYDGSFTRLRSELGDRRRLWIETESRDPPVLEGAVYIGQREGRHEYSFDASQVSIAALLQQAATKTRLLDVETHRADIDDVIADIYERWQNGRSSADH